MGILLLSHVMKGHCERQIEHLYIAHFLFNDGGEEGAPRLKPSVKFKLVSKANS